MKSIYDSISKAYINMLVEEYLSEEMLMEDRLDRIKTDNKFLDTSHDPYAIHHDPERIIDHFAEHADPSVNKIHTQYLVGLYKRKAIRQDDAQRINGVLRQFDTYKQFLQPTEKQLTVKGYPSISSIEDKIAPHIGKATSLRDAREKIKQNPLDMEGHRQVWGDDNIKAYDVTDKEVSKKLYANEKSKRPGAFPTNWCTAREDEKNMYDFYKKDGDLIAIHHKDGSLYQYFVNGGEFKDRNNEDISDTDWNKIKDSVHKMWSEKPELLLGKQNDNLNESFDSPSKTTEIPEDSMLHQMGSMSAAMIGGTNFKMDKLDGNGYIIQFDKDGATELHHVDDNLSGGYSTNKSVPIRMVGTFKDRAKVLIDAGRRVRIVAHSTLADPFRNITKRLVARNPEYKVSDPVYGVHEMTGDKTVSWEISK